MTDTSDEWVQRLHDDSAARLEAIARIGSDDLVLAVRLLGRANHCVILITDALHVLERLSPWEYHELRKALGHGSGFDSPGWKQLRRLAHPLWDAFSALLDRRGLRRPGAHHRGQRDVQREEPRREVVAFRDARPVRDVGEPRALDVDDAPAGAPQPRVDADHPHCPGLPLVASRPH